jgi:hypothetical protein
MDDEPEERVVTVAKKSVHELQRASFEWWSRAGGGLWRGPAAG